MWDLNAWYSLWVTTFCQILKLLYQFEWPRLQHLIESLSDFYQYYVGVKYTTVPVWMTVFTIILLLLPISYEITSPSNDKGFWL